MKLDAMHIYIFVFRSVVHTSYVNFFVENYEYLGYDINLDYAKKRCK